MNEEVVDAVVVGGGPAGAAAATVLARGGAEVVLVDKATFPRDKCCGDGLTAAALRELDWLGLSPAVVPGWQRVDEAWVRGPTGHTVRFPLPEGHGQYAACAPRAELDAALIDVARSAGVKVYDGHGLDGARETEGGIALDVAGLGTLLARFVIGADGMWSPLRKALGASSPGYLGEWHAFRQYFRHTSPASESLWVWFERDLLPGYAWSFPLPGRRANVGFGIRRGSGIATREMKALWPELLARPHIRAVVGDHAEPEAPHKAWPIPARVDDTPLTAARGRVLFTGDAACATDPMTGEGIAQALLTGRWAAEAISAAVAAGEDRPERVGDRYERDVRRGLWADHRMSLRLGRAIAHRRGINAALRLAGSSTWSRHHFGRWLFEDSPRAVLVTPRRWGHGALARPGAYATRTGDVGRWARP